MFDGLYFYELILVVLGILLFITLLIILIIYVAQKRALSKVLFSFFILPIAMIGFPGYQKITFDKGVVAIEKLNKELAANPSDESISTKLEKALSNVEERPVTNSEINLEIAKAQAGIGDTLKALVSVDKAIKNNSGSAEATDLKEQLNTPGVRFEKLTEEVEKKPDDPQLRLNLIEAASNLEKNSNTDPTTVKRLTKSYIALGDTTKVLNYADTLSKIDPKTQKFVGDVRKRFDKRRSK